MDTLSFRVRVTLPIPPPCYRCLVQCRTGRQIILERDTSSGRPVVRIPYMCQCVSFVQESPGRGVERGSEEQ